MYIGLTTKQWTELREHLDTPTERAAFLFAQPDDDNLRIVETWLVDDHHYDVRSHDEILLSEDVRPEVIGRAHVGNYVVVELHSHWWPGPRTAFSLYDLHNLTEFAPHMLWRLPGRPYVALVMGRESYDALIWTSRDQVGVLDGLIIDSQIVRPTNLSFEPYQRIAAQ